MLCEELVDISLDDAGLAASQLPDDEDLEDVFSPPCLAVHDATAHNTLKVLYGNSTAAALTDLTTEVSNDNDEMFEKTEHNVYNVRSYFKFNFQSILMITKIS